jgi:L-histidine N-alpha-methyltransferase
MDGSPTSEPKALAALTTDGPAEASAVLEPGYDVEELGYDVLDGLTRPHKELSSRFLYDERGSELFEEILKLPEYYQGRAEMAILRSHAVAVMRRCGPTEIVDLGAGSGEKANLLLGAAAPRTLAYSPVDLSSDMLRLCEAQVSGRWSHVNVTPIQGDITNLSELLEPLASESRRMIVMFGGTVGNLLLGARRRFLKDVAGLLGENGYAMLGIDLLKDPAAIEAAYADSAGVTAEFNRNILTTLNRRLGADFPHDAFDHAIVFDEAKSWIEMRLRARRRCLIHFAVLDWSVELAPGEEIRTEVSAKFSRESFTREVEWCGLEVVDWFSDNRCQFAIPLLRAATAL